MSGCGRGLLIGGASASRVREALRTRDIHFKRFEEQGQVVSQFYRDLYTQGFDVDMDGRVVRETLEPPVAVLAATVKSDDQ